MNQDALRQLLQQIQAGQLGVEDGLAAASRKLRNDCKLMLPRPIVVANMSRRESRSTA